MDRSSIILELETILNNSGYFKKVYTALTDINKENSFPIAWILLGNEGIGSEGNTIDISGRIISGYIRLGVKQNRGKDEINPLIDNIYSLLKDNNTLNDSCLKCEIKSITTSEGLLYPYEVAEIVLNILIR